MTMMELVEVSHRYGGAASGLNVLDHVNLELAPKEIAAVVGESGCGKTTLGRIVTGLVRPLAGEVRFEGVEISRLGRRADRRYRRAVQLVHQDPYASLNPALPIGDILGAAMLHHGIISRRGLEGELLRLLDLVGLEGAPGLLRRYPHQLSGGQRQRVAIARAVSLHPALIVADEAVSMLDVSMKVAIMQLMLDIHRKESLSYLFISHDLGVVRQFARQGRTIVMFYGVIVEEGPTEVVINTPRHPYTRLLLTALPVPDPRVARIRRQEAGPVDPGGVPSATGCVFANRCPMVEEECRRARPALTEAAPGHRTACLLWDRIPPPI